MADEPRSRPTTPPATARPPGAPEPIRVRQLQSSGSTVALPSPARGGTLLAGKRATGETIVIQYEPWQRHHRVREYEDGGDGKLGSLKREVCIPESWVAYTPEPDAV